MPCNGIFNGYYIFIVNHSLNENDRHIHIKRSAFMIPDFIVIKIVTVPISESNGPIRARHAP